AEFPELGDVILGRFVIERGVEAEFVYEPRDFVVASGDSHGAAAFDFCDLADERADRACGPGNDNGLTGLGLADIEKAEIGRHARHAEDAERGRRWSEARVKLLQTLAVRYGEFLPAPVADDDVSHLKFGIRGLRDFADRAADHELADIDGIGVRADAVHAAAHVWIDRKKNRAQENLAACERGNRRGDEPEVGFLWHPHRTRGED